jgi:hypothetical protein
VDLGKELLHIPQAPLLAWIWANSSTLSLKLLRQCGLGQGALGSGGGERVGLDLVAGAQILVMWSMEVQIKWPEARFFLFD